MKKVLSVMIAVVICMALCVSAASAVSYGNLTSDEIASILGVDKSDLGNLDSLVKDLEANATTASSGSPLDGLSDLLGGFDISSIAGSLTGGDDALSSITGMFEGLGGDFDVSSLTDMISGVFGDSGISLDSITGALGSFDIGSILGGDSASGAMDTMSSLMDGLMSGLEGLGLDTSKLDGLKDNDIVNFFANLYMGIGGSGDDSGTVVTTAPTTAPAVATTTAPKTGDTSAVFAAVATIAVAAGAAFVCLKKKND